MVIGLLVSLENSCVANSNAKSKYLIVVPFYLTFPIISQDRLSFKSINKTSQQPPTTKTKQAQR